MWAKADMPLRSRIQNSVVFAAKRYLADWGYNKAALWADPDNNTLQLAGDLVMKVGIENETVKVHYEPGWEEQFQETGWENTLKQFNEKLNRGANKGAGKGKNGKGE